MLESYCRKKLMHYVIACTNDDLLASRITKGIDIRQAITRVADAWKENSVETIKNCFLKCGFTEQTIEDEDDIVDEEFIALSNEVADSECDMIAVEHVVFDVETWNSFSAIKSDMMDWWVS